MDAATEWARGAGSGIQEAVNETGASSSPRGRLRVHTDPAVARLLLAPRMGAFLRANPEVSVELMVRHELTDPTTGRPFPWEFAIESVGRGVSGLDGGAVSAVPALPVAAPAFSKGTRLR
jgi:hypothetical protein